MSRYSTSGTTGRPAVESERIRSAARRTCSFTSRYARFSEWRSFVSDRLKATIRSVTSSLSVTASPMFSSTTSSAPIEVFEGSTDRRPYEAIVENTKTAKAMKRKMREAAKSVLVDELGGRPVRTLEHTRTHNFRTLNGVELED